MAADHSIERDTQRRGTFTRSVGALPPCAGHIKRLARPMRSQTKHSCSCVKVVDGRARKTSGHLKPMPAWNVLLRDHPPRVHQLGGVRGKPDDDRRERAHAKTHGTQICPWWPGV